MPRESIIEDLFHLLNIDFGIESSIPENTFSTNYYSNFHDDDATLNRILAQSLNEVKHHDKPVKKSFLDKLKAFNLKEKNCKKNEKGILELPTCSVCCTQMKIGDKTLLIPCGHMYHPNCVKPWFEKNNTCPICRHELPTEK